MLKLLLFIITLNINLQLHANSNVPTSNSSFKKPDKPLIVGYIDFQPLYGTVNKKPEGILIDITRKVFENLDLSYKQRSMPTKRLFSSLKKGRIQVWCGIKINELQASVWSGNEVLHHLTLNFYSLSKGLNIVKKSDLIGKKVILLLGYNYGGWGEYIRNKKNGVNFIDVKSHDDALRLLKKGRYQYLLNYRAPMNIALNKSPAPDLEQQTISKLPIVFNITKKMANSKELLKHLDSSLAKLVKEAKVVIQ
jgi:polar amino acid transport system substrate-binding protein